MDMFIYGRLRSCAAGVAGYTGAEIFCVMFEPELVSIGVYCGVEQISSNLWSARSAGEIRYKCTNIDVYLWDKERKLAIVVTVTSVKVLGKLHHLRQSRLVWLK